MKKIFPILALSLLSTASIAKNSVTTVSQVSQSITLTDDVDYVITDATPFTTAGSVNIKNTRYAVGCGLLADLAGILAAIFLAYLFFA